MSATVQPVKLSRLREVKTGGIEVKNRALPERLNPKGPGVQVLETLNFVFQGQQVIFAGWISEFRELIFLPGLGENFVREGFRELEQIGFVAITGNYFVPTTVFLDYYGKED